MQKIKTSSGMNQLKINNAKSTGGVCLELQELHDILFIAFILMPESVFKKINVSICRHGFDDVDSRS